MADDKPTVTYRSSKLVPQHMSRSVRSYQVQDGELADIATMNGWMTTSFSLAGSCFAAAGGLWASMLIEERPSVNAVEFMPILESIGVIAGLVFLLFGLVAWKSKVSVVDRIKRESGERGYASLWNAWLWFRPPTP